MRSPRIIEMARIATGSTRQKLTVCVPERGWLDAWWVTKAMARCVVGRTKYNLELAEVQVCIVTQKLRLEAPATRR